MSNASPEGPGGARHIGNEVDGKGWEIIRQGDLMLGLSLPPMCPNMVSYYSHMSIIWLHLHHTLTQTFLYLK